MDHGKLSSRGRMALLVVVVATALVLVLAAAAFADAPTVTITGPQYYTMSPSPSPSPTAAVPAVHSPEVSLYLQANNPDANAYRLSNNGGTTWGDVELFGLLYPYASYPYRWWGLFNETSDPAATLDGSHTVTAQFSTDEGTTWGASVSATTLLDTQLPIVTACEGYWNNNFPYKLTARDQINLAGVQTIYYSVDAGALVAVQNTQPLGTKAPLTTTFDLAGETGTEHNVSYAAMDYAGNYSFGNVYDSARLVKGRDLGRIRYLDTAYVTIDRTAPTVKARGVGKSWHYAPVAVRFSATDDDAGVCTIQYSITGKKATKPGAWTVGNSVLVTSYGKHKVWYQAVDAAQPMGNASAPAWVMVKIHR
jgi:hypothetical protein